MNRNVSWLGVVIVAGALTAFPGCKPKQREKEAPQPKQETAAPQQKHETRVVLTCGMPGHPQYEPGKQPADGKCPVCGMKLVEKKLEGSEKAK